jgi:hypothetical protein
MSWKLVKSKIDSLFIRSIMGLFTCLRHRSAIFMSHVPWLGTFILKVPSLAKDLKAFRTYAKGRAITRKTQGSPHKDLFYYLVGPR